MSPALIGAAIGAVVGFASFAVLSMIAGKLALDKDDAKRRIAGVLKSVAWFDLVLFTVVGYVVGPMVLG